MDSPALMIGNGGLPAFPSRLALITEQVQNVLSLKSSIFWTAVGGAAAGAFFLLIFALKHALSLATSKKAVEEQPEEADEATALLPESATCGPTGWHAPPPKVETAAKETTWGVLIFSTLMAVPTLLGTWCWPLLLVAAFPAANSNIESDENREITHHFTWGADFVLFGAVLCYMLRTSTRSGIRWWGPLLTVALGSLLLILDPSRHVLLDHGGVFVEPKYLAMFDKNSLSWIGKFCQISSFVGLGMLFFGLLWFLNTPEDCKTS